MRGKIVLCDALNWGEGTTTAGAEGMIMRDGALKDFALSFSLPASYMDWTNTTQLEKYLNSTRYFNFISLPQFDVIFVEPMDENEMVLEQTGGKSTEKHRG